MAKVFYVGWQSERLVAVCTECGALSMTDLHALLSLNDPAVRSYITAPNEESQQRELGDLVERAREITGRVLSSYWRSEPALADDLADLTAGVMLRIVHKLHAARKCTDEAVHHFDDYVARLTYNAVNDFRRRRYPERNRLKRRIRHVLGRDRHFAIWDTPAGQMTGLAAWREAPDGLVSINGDLDLGALLDPEHVEDALLALFRQVGKPMTLDAVTSVLCSAWGIHEASHVSLTAVDQSSGHAVDYECRETLGIVWEEIRALPQRQRAALLLNMRDAYGLNAAVLLPLTGAATFDEIASAIGMTPAGLMAIWNALPLPDERIGRILGLSRQQIINLRKSARRRLARRLEGRQRPRKA